MRLRDCPETSKAPRRAQLCVTAVCLSLVALISISAFEISAQDLGSFGKPSGGSKGSGTASGSKTSGSTTSGSKRKKKSSGKSKGSAKTSGSTTGSGSKRKVACATQKFQSDAERREAFERAVAEGKELFGKRDYRRAEAVLKDAIRYQCDSRTFYELGLVYRAEQRWSLAEDAFQDALQLESGNVEALVALSNVMTRLLFGSEVGGRYGEAETLARRAVFLSPNSADANQQLGEALEALGRISRETQAYFEQATRLNPKSASAFAHLARILRKTGKPKESAKAMTTAIGLATDVESKIEVGEILQTLQRFGEAESILREALKEDEWNPMGLQLLAQALLRQQKNEEAEAVLTKAASRTSQSIVPFLSLASFYLQRQKFDEAEKILRNAIPLAAAGERATVARQLGILADAYRTGGRTADASRIAQLVKSLGPARG